MFPAQDMGASFRLVELFCDGGEETKKRVDQLSFASNGLLNPVHSVWQPADERVTAVSKTGHSTLLLPLSGVSCYESVHEG